MTNQTFKTELMNILVPMTKLFMKKDPTSSKMFFMDIDQDNVIFVYDAEQKKAFFQVSQLVMGVDDFVEFFCKKYNGHQQGYIAHTKKCADRQMLVYENFYDEIVNN